jgi:cell division protein FtsQ
VASQRRLHAALRAAILPAPARRSGVGIDPSRFLPSGRSLALGFALVGIGVLAYWGARSTALFAVRAVEIRGVPPAEAAAVRDALAPLVGTSLVSLRRRDVERRLAGLPGVRGFSYDRAFPHTLSLVVVPEVPVALVRRGGESWLVSRRGRVLRRAARRELLALPRIWLPRRVELAVGTTLSDGGGGAAARALALLAALRFPAPARTVRTEAELTYVLRSGLEIRLGSWREASLKLEIAGRILSRLDPGTRYLDVSMPARPVAGTTLNSKLEVEA